ncbi:MAG: type II toxin-antitoxin system Phd/YefM family antitoxin [Thermomicrobiales bacterium]
MQKITIPTQVLKFTEARPRLSELLNEVFRRETRVLIKKGSIPVVAIVSVDDLERLTRLDAERAQAFSVFEETGAAFSDQSPDEIEQEVERALAEVRADERARRGIAFGQ